MIGSAIWEPTRQLISVTSADLKEISIRLNEDLNALNVAIMILRLVMWLNGLVVIWVTLKRVQWSMAGMKKFVTGRNI